ncbi:hypothetical protein OFC47_27740, partial [Escherichia coli]|nr:hypothetical protein [Escherichia coli]
TPDNRPLYEPSTGPETTASRGVCSNLFHSSLFDVGILRDTLLPKLLSGEITLPEAEQAVSEVENV